MSEIRLIACDIDDTLLGPGEKLEPSTIFEIQKWVDQGVHFVFTSGRLPTGIDPLLHEIGLTDSCVVACNGAWVYCGSEILHQSRLLGGLVLPILESVIDAGFTVLYSLGGQEFCHIETPGSEEKRRKRGSYHPIRPLQPQDAVLKLNLLNDSADSETVAAVRKRLNALPGIQITQYGDRGFEIVTADTNKWEGLKCVCQRLHCPSEAVLAIGDNENDSEMLQQVGHAATVQNAIPWIQSLVQYVSPYPRQAGVRDILRRMQRAGKE